ncbi:hypothetical protein MRB53_022944 [Persea americana]|uniref:Uncharacterized protein n=1 Tax=Persea americana TaxID=3435 RepID=A0ACC2L7W2_PERAE|nr:hypothetical protein MRB53_022944 [Persea americana]
MNLLRFAPHSCWLLLEQNRTILDRNPHFPYRIRVSEKNLSSFLSEFSSRSCWIKIPSSEIPKKRGSELVSFSIHVVELQISALKSTFTFTDLVRERFWMGGFVDDAGFLEALCEGFMDFLDLAMDYGSSLKA